MESGRDIWRGQGQEYDEETYTGSNCHKEREEGKVGDDRTFTEQDQLARGTGQGSETKPRSGVVTIDESLRPVGGTSTSSPRPTHFPTRTTHVTGLLSLSPVGRFTLTPPHLSPSVTSVSPPCCLCPTDHLGIKFVGGPRSHFELPPRGHSSTPTLLVPLRKVR